MTFPFSPICEISSLRIWPIIMICVMPQKSYFTQSGPQFCSLETKEVMAETCVALTALQRGAHISVTSVIRLPRLCAAGVRIYIIAGCWQLKKHCTESVCVNSEPDDDWGPSHYGPGTRTTDVRVVTLRTNDLSPISPQSNFLSCSECIGPFIMW